MQSLFEIGQLSDAALSSDLNKYLTKCDTNQANIEAEIAELTDEYMDSAEMICDTVLDESFIDYDQFWTTFKAMVNAYAFDNEASMLAFAKSLAQETMTAIQKRAEWKVTK